MFLKYKNQDFACITWIKSTIQCPPPHPTSMLMASRLKFLYFGKKRENKEGRAKPGDDIHQTPFSEAGVGNG